MHCYVFVALFELRGAYQYIVCGVRFAIYYIYILCLVSICFSPILVEGLWKFELFGFLIVLVQLTSHALFSFSSKTCWGLWNTNNCLDLGFFSLLISLGSFHKEKLIWVSKTKSSILGSQNICGFVLKGPNQHGESLFSSFLGNCFSFFFLISNQKSWLMQI